jgi:hypothetical protein
LWPLQMIQNSHNGFKATDLNYNRDQLIGP